MSKTLKSLMIVACLLGLVVLAACSRDITTVQQMDPGASQCFNCHTDNRANDQYGLLDKEMEWSNSSHGIGNYVGYAGGREGCSGCHSGSGFQARLEGLTDVPYATTIGCWSCHAPHTNGTFALRVTTPQPLSNGHTMDLGRSNICTACHVGRTTVQSAVVDAPGDSATITSTHWGAHHGPQGDIFEGQNGYEYAGKTYRRDVPPAHNDNEKTRCFGCHGNANPAVDLGGHSFQQTNAADDDNVASCNRCHSNLTDFDYNDVQSDVEEQLATLEGLLQDLHFLDEDGGLIEDARGTKDEIGAAWNYILVEEDRSMGVHNPDYVRDLLQYSIDALSK